MVRIPDFCTLLSGFLYNPLSPPPLPPISQTFPKTLQNPRPLVTDWPLYNPSESIGPTCLTCLQYDTVDGSAPCKTTSSFSHSTNVYFLLILNMSVDIIIFFSLKYDSGTPELLSLGFSLLWIFQTVGTVWHLSNSSASGSYLKEDWPCLKV